MRLAFLVLLSHWLRHPVQALLVVLGLAMATTLWSAVQAINGEARAAYEQAAAVLDLAEPPRLLPQSANLDLATYVRLRRAGWPVSPVLEGRFPGADGGVTLQGIDLLSHPLAPTLAAASEAASEAASAAPLAALTAQIAFASPDTASQFAPEGWQVFEVESLPQDIVFADISLVAQVLARPDSLSYLLLLGDPPAGGGDLSALAPDLKRVASGPGSPATDLTRSFQLNLTAFGFLSFAVGLFIVQGMLSLAVDQRKGMIKTLRHLGVDRQNLYAALLVEILTLAVLAGLVGLVLGFLLAGLLVEDVSATLTGLFGAKLDGQLRFRWGWALSGLAMCAIGTILASLQAFVVLASTADPHGLPARIAAGFAQQGATVLSAAGLLCILLGSAVFLTLGGLLGGFALLGGLLLGAALLLPALIVVTLKQLSKWFRGLFAEILMADSRHQLPGLAMALMALLLAISTNIGVGTMVSSFRFTFETWLEKRLSADLYLSLDSEDALEEVLEWAKDNTRIALPMYRAAQQVLGQDVTLRAMEVDEQLRRDWPLLAQAPEVWDQFDAGTAILINEQFAHRSGLSLGDMVSVTPDWRPQVAAIYADYGNPKAEISLSHRGAGVRVPQLQPVQVAIRSTTPAQDRNKILQEIEQNDISISVREQVQGFSLAVFDRTFTVTAALNVLTLAVAGFALFTSFLTQWSSRLPQLAPLWAIGMTRQRLAVLELSRSLILAAVTALLALPLGLILAWVLLSVINQEAFGWRLPMWIFPGQIATTAAMSGLVATAAALLPMLRLLRLPPDQLLRGFSDDR